MILNPFLEGVILIVIGIACMVMGSVWKVDGLPMIGNTVFGVGIGYVGKTAVESAQKP